MFGKHCIKWSCGWQSTIALSLGEAEYYAGVKGAGVGLQLQSLLADWGISVKLILRADSNSAIGTASRRGLGKLRHVQTRYLWVQERVAQSALKLEKVNTKHNSTDMCTNPVPTETLNKMMV